MISIATSLPWVANSSIWKQLIMAADQSWRICVQERLHSIHVNDIILGISINFAFQLHEALGDRLILPLM